MSETKQERALRWSGGFDSNYICLDEVDDCFNDIDPREGLVLRLEATIKDIRLAIIEGRESGPI